jgi:membrane protein
MSDWINRIKDATKRWEKFVSQDIWSIGTPGEEIPQGFLIQQIRVFILLATKIAGGTLMLRAAALTFATLLSIVPLLAVIVFVIQTFNLGERFYGNLKPYMEDTIVELAEKFPGGKKNEAAIEESATDPGNDPTIVQEEGPPLPETEVMVQEENEENIEPAEVDSEDPSESQIGEKDAEITKDLVDTLFQGLNRSGEEGLEDPAEWLNGIAENIEKLASDAATNKAALGVSSFLLILTTVFGMMRNVEKTFNNIWGVRPSRSWFRTASDYFMITLMLPFVMTATLGMTAALQSERITEALGPLAIVVDGGKLLVTVLVLAALYAFIPSTNVKRRYALIGGLIAGVLWILLTEVYFSSNRALVRYQAVLSAFAQFPMILMWIYLSWATFIFGAEVTYAYQNEKTFAMERFAERASYAYREALGVRAMLEIGKRFQDSMDAFVVEHAAANWNVPSRLMNEVLYEMEKAGLVRTSATEPVSYLPGRPLDKIRLNEVQEVLRNVGEDPSLLLEDEDYKPFFNDLYEDTDYEKQTVSEVLVHFNPLQTNSDESEAG